MLFGVNRPKNISLRTQAVTTLPLTKTRLPPVSTHPVLLEYVLTRVLTSILLHRALGPMHFITSHTYVDVHNHASQLCLDTAASLYSKDGIEAGVTLCPCLLELLHATYAQNQNAAGRLDSTAYDMSGGQ